MEFKEFLNIIRKKRWVILTATITAGFISAALSLFVMAPVYEGKSSLIIGHPLGNEAN
jgi:capsular polysaccharide biosynthesis protein